MAQEISTWQEVALVAAPVVSAFAAAASWAAVRQTRRLAREEQAPLLMVAVNIIAEANGVKSVGATVVNAGGGAARGVSFVIAQSPFWSAGPVGDAFLFPGRAKRIWTDITPSNAAEINAMVVCRDRDRFAHYWTQKEDHRVFKTRIRRRPKYRGDATVVFKEFFPDFDSATWAPAQYKVSDHL